MEEDKPDEVEMHPVLPEKKRLLNRHERRAMIKDVLTRDERLVVQEMKTDIVMALVKPKRMTKAQLRRRRRKDAER
jgi:hypothetical protein